MKLPIFAALDLDNKQQALDLAEKLSSFIKGFKVGPRLGFQLEQKDWKKLSDLGEVFIDYKFFDIPSTVEAAVKRCASFGASYCTVHAMNGKVCLEALAEIPNIKVLAVTLLTSFDSKTNPLPLSGEKSSDSLVAQLLDEGYKAGLRNFVCSPLEVSALKSKYSDIFLVTPGIRLSSDSKDDQKRTATPSEAWASGSDYLVMGRSITKATDFDKLKEDLILEWQKIK